MIVRVVLAGAVVGGIFVMSPARQGSGDPARDVAAMRQGMVGTVLENAAPLTAAIPLLTAGHARSALDAAVDTALARGASEAGTRAAGVPLPPAARRAAIDTLRPLDRRAAWRGANDG